MTIAPYDFGRPGRLTGERESRLASWLRRAGALANKTWLKQLPFQAECAFHSCDMHRAQDALGRLAETAVAYRLGLGAGKLTTLVAMPRPLVLAVAAGLTGDAGTALPEDRDLSVVEESLYAFFVNRHVLPHLEETWPGAEPARLELSQAEINPRWSRLFAADVPVVMCTFRLTGAFGEEQWHWLLPREGLLGLLDQPSATAVAAPADVALVRQQVEARVHDLPVEIVVSLGSVNVRLAQLSTLGVGDVLVLDQRVSEPLTARIGEDGKFRAWPGRIGSCQALKIESFLSR